MKKILFLMGFIFVGACSYLPEVDWKFWDDETIQNKHAYDNVNPYLWKAAYDKLAFLGFDRVEPDKGWLETKWSTPDNGDRMKVQVWINSPALRADSLQVVVVKQSFVGDRWQKKTANYALAQEIEKEILLKARDLYKVNVVR